MEQSKRLAVWPYKINSITVRKKTVKRNKTNEERETETWIFRCAIGNENFAGSEKVLVRFKGTHTWPGQKRFQDLLTGKTPDANGEIVINDIPAELQASLDNQDAWTPNRAFGCTGIIFATIPVDPVNPEQEYYIWDNEADEPVVDKHDNPLIRKVEEVVCTCIYMPDPETGQGMWVSEYGGSLEDGLRTEMDTAIQRNRYKKKKSLTTAPDQEEARAAVEAKAAM